MGRAPARDGREDFARIAVGPLLQAFCCSVVVCAFVGRSELIFPADDASVGAIRKRVF